ncbi:SLC13 family permease [Desulfovibrio sp. OttesenSCG-928-F20]|nr:SLC13 family permease [Desulfovibrio sp. OttesenSCG-928-F20]
MASDLWVTVVTLVVLFGTVAFFILGRHRSDLIAICSLLCLLLTGVLTPAEAIVGFSNNVIIIIGGMFVVGGAIVRSGLASIISRKILSVAGANQNLLFVLVMFITGIIGALVSNTGTVAIMMPIVVSMALSLDASPGRFLMPLAFMSSLGGMLTLIGNAPNMVANEAYVKAGFESLTLFSFFPVGVICLTFGLLILVPFSSWMLARLKKDKGDVKGNGPSLNDLADKYHLAEHMYKVRVPAASPMIEQTLADLALTGKFGVSIQEIRRGRETKLAKAEQIAPGPKVVIKAGDILYVLSSGERAASFMDAYGLERMDNENGKDAQDKYRFDSIGICELVLMSSSRLVGLTVESSELREQFGLMLLGIQRGDQYILENFRSQVMQAGDALLVQGSWENIARLEKYSSHWVVVGRPQEHAINGGKGSPVFVSMVIVAMILSMALGILPTVTSVMTAAVVLVIGGCFKNMEDVYSFINWETLVMIAAMLPMATAMEKAGLVAVVSKYMTVVGVTYGPYMALAVVYGVTSALNIVISFTPLTLLVAPVAIRIAVDLGYSAEPFIFAVATAASMCFASSFSTPSNALVVSPGRYTFADYLKVGLPMQILLGIIMVIALPILFPF